MKSLRRRRTRMLCFTGAFAVFSGGWLLINALVGSWWWAALHAGFVVVQMYFFRWWWRLNTDEIVVVFPINPSTYE